MWFCIFKKARKRLKGNFYAAQCYLSCLLFAEFYEFSLRILPFDYETKACLKILCRYSIVHRRSITLKKAQSLQTHSIAYQNTWNLCLCFMWRWSHFTWIAKNVKKSGYYYSIKVKKIIVEVQNYSKKVMKSN